jgi:hypothetical protein
MSEANIIVFDEYESRIDTIKEYADFIPDVTTDEGYEKSKRVSLDAGKLLTAIEKDRKSEKAFYLNGGKQVDLQAKSLVERIELVQLPHKSAYKELDKLKKEREEARKSLLRDRIERIQGITESVSLSTSTEIKKAIELLESEDCSGFEEYSELAIESKKVSLESLNVLFEKNYKEENDAIELAKLKKEQAEREQKEREDKIASDAREAAEAEAAKAIKAKEEAKQAEELAIKRSEEAAKALVESEKASKLAAIEAEKAAKVRAEEAAKAAKQAEINKQEAIKQKEAEDLAKREANQKHIGKIRGEAKGDLMVLGIDEKTAKEIVLAISNGKIKNVSIQY